MAKRDLKPVRSKAEAKELGKKGGIASGKKRREKRSLRQRLEVLLESPSKDNPKLDNGEMVCISLIKKAMKGDVAAFSVLRDTIGQKPTERTESKSEIRGNMAINNPLDGLTTEELRRIIAATGSIHGKD